MSSHRKKRSEYSQFLTRVSKLSHDAINLSIVQHRVIGATLVKSFNHIVKTHFVRIACPVGNLFRHTRRSRQQPDPRICPSGQKIHSIIESV